MSVTDAEVDKFFQSVLLPLLRDILVPFNKMKDIYSLLEKDTISNKLGEFIKENTKSVLEQREKLFQLEEDYPWLKDRFKASSKALRAYCGTQDEKQPTELESLLFTKYKSWNDLLIDKPELKEAKDIHLALVMLTVTQIAYKFRIFFYVMSGIDEYDEVMEKDKKRTGEERAEVMKKDKKIKVD